jgi:hypothetical protein
MIKTALGPLVDAASCSRCKEGIQQTVKSVVAGWVGIRVRIQISQRSQVADEWLLQTTI